MGKKKILVIFTGALELGGIERSLLGLLDAIDYERYEVDLFLYGHHGPLFGLIHKNVSILPEIKDLAYLREGFSVKIRHKAFLSAWARIRCEIKKKFNNGVNFDEVYAKIVNHKVAALETHYNLAIGFFRPFDVLLNKVNADVKIGWIHTDYSSYSTNVQWLLRDYKSLDMIAAVSEECKNSFISILPQLKDKVTVIENILSKQFILKQSQEYDASAEMPSDGATTILTIGRFSHQKKMDEIPEICRQIRARGLDIKWYLIGYDGGEEPLIRQKIVEAGMQEYVIILGKKENPYPYIKACDIYAQPSRYEGKSVAVREAQILNKPVVITNYATAPSQLEDGVDGVIVPMDIEGCAMGIAELILDPELQQRLIENTKKRDYTNAGEIEKIYRLAM
jgi:glycosyltransferase involved in cell wall biosynthesis